jgi:hypothetical protein
VNLRQLCDASVQLGIALDVRGEAALRRQMEQARLVFEALPEWQEPYFDTERLRYPFGDVRVLNGPEDVELHSVLLGINIGISDFLLARELHASGTRIDAVIAHHPTGIAPSQVQDYMPVSIDYLVAEGVPRADAEDCIRRYIREKLQHLEDNYRVGPDTAKLLGFPFACIHTPADYYMRVGVRTAFAAHPPETPLEAVRALLTIPEVDSAARISGAVPRVMSCDPSRPIGRVLLTFGGGYILPPEAYHLLGKAGVNTVVQIGCSPAHAQAAEAPSSYWLMER